MSAGLTLTLLGLGFVAFLAAGVFIVWCLTEDEPPFRSEPGLRWPQRVAPPDGPVVGRHSEPPGSETP